MSVYFVYFDVRGQQGFAFFTWGSVITQNCSEMKCSAFLKIYTVSLFPRRPSGQARWERTGAVMRWGGPWSADLAELKAAVRTVRTVTVLQPSRLELQRFITCTVCLFTFTGSGPQGLGISERSSLPLYHFIHSPKWAPVGLTCIKNLRKYLFWRDYVISLMHNKLIISNEPWLRSVLSIKNRSSNIN